MSMKEYSIVDTGFFIDDYACAILMRAWHKEEDIFGDDEGKELARLCDDPNFFKKAATGDLPEEFFSISDVVEFGQTFEGGSFVYCSSFAGEVNTIDDIDCNTHDICRTFSDDWICFIGLAKEKSWFKAAYASVDEMVAEIKDYFGDIAGYFPEDFDWAVRICNIVGTDFC